MPNNNRFGFESNVSESVKGRGGKPIFTYWEDRLKIGNILTKSQIAFVVISGCSLAEIIELRSLIQNSANKNITIYAISDQAVAGVITVPSRKAFFEQEAVAA